MKMEGSLAQSTVLGLRVQHRLQSRNTASEQQWTRKMKNEGNKNRKKGDGSGIGIGNGSGIRSGLCRGRANSGNPPSHAGTRPQAPTRAPARAPAQAQAQAQARRLCDACTHRPAHEINASTQPTERKNDGSPKAPIIMFPGQADAEAGSSRGRGRGKERRDGRRVWHS